MAVRVKRAHLEHEVGRFMLATTGIRPAQPTFRPGQYEVLEAVLRHRKDVIVRVSTAGGKSLPYAILASVTRKIVVVVEPLQSIVSEQTERFQRYVPTLDVNHIANNTIDANITNLAHTGGLRASSYPYVIFSGIVSTDTL
jgi:superfamily II DNA or RNA helicase